MLFEVIGFDEQEKWNKIIGENSDVYYKREYIYSFYKNGDGNPFLAYALDEENNVIFNVFLKNDIANMKQYSGLIENNKYFDIITPYGYGGADTIKQENTQLVEYFFEKFEEYCNKNNIVSEFIRFNPLNNNQENYKNSDYELIECSNTIYMNLENDEQIWNEMESRCRNTIRKAEKQEIEIKIGYNEEMLDEFQKIYSATMQRDNAKDYYFFGEQFFKDYYDMMKDNSFIITAYFENKPISSSLFIYSNENAHYHLSGTLTEYLRLGANSLIIFEAAKELCKRGCKKLHLGGGYGGNDSPLLKFKKSFSKNEMLNFYIGKRIYNKQVYDKLVSIREKEESFDKNSSFFPLYRA